MKFARNIPPKGTVRDWLNSRAAQSGDTLAYVFTDGSASLTWGDLASNANRLACALTAQGCAKGDSIAIMMPNSRDSVIAFFAVTYGGFRAAVINLAAGDEAIEYALDHCDARLAFVGDAQMEQFERAKTDVLKRMDIAAGATADLIDINSTDHALLMYTSGTTGRPKGVLHSNASLLAGGWTTALAHQLTPQDRGLCVLPMCHINGLCVTVISTLISGGSLAMAPKFSGSQFWKQADDLGITWFSVVPTIISHLLHGQADPNAATKARIRFGRSASSALAPDVQTAFEKRFDMPIVETMGLTETAAQILSNPLPPGTRKIGSPGLAYGNEIQVLAPDQTVLGCNLQGELAVRGPNVMLGYLKDQTATLEALTTDGWLRTGDLGHVDDEGYVFVTGRLKELIIKGGENIAPREIDEVLYSNTQVVEAAAFARPCRVYGERIEAAVKLAENTSVDEQQLLALCQSRLGKFKSPDRIYVLPELPKGPSGKIQRKSLADMID
jgi:acyl-CoA synthetase (AMP-forming)/AMP-acid ligase II